MRVYYTREGQNGYTKFHIFTGVKNDRYIENIKSIVKFWYDGSVRFQENFEVPAGVSQEWAYTQLKLIEWIFSGTFKIGPDSGIEVLKHI